MIDVELLKDVIGPDGEVQLESAVDHVAQEMVNADLAQFGTHWPWPTGDTPAEIRCRQEARELARVAIKAFMAWANEEGS